MDALAIPLGRESKDTLPPIALDDRISTDTELFTPSLSSAAIPRHDLDGTVPGRLTVSSGAKDNFGGHEISARQQVGNTE